ncbi:MAG TPA: cation:proton antiporter [Candidatus Thermoplasmatota archaeon]|nr:cation:proton antiporter [Candidatus Thermoplasmatota archaeon]
MTLDAAGALATVGAVAVAAVLASAAFRRTNIPDVLLLIALGILAGPLLHLLDPALFHALAPVASIAAVLVILFDGGLDVRAGELARGAGPALAVALASFVLASAGAAALAVALLGLGLAHAVLLGMCFGGAGVAIVIPLIQRMGVGRDASALVSLSSALSDVLLIVSVFALASALAASGAGESAAFFPVLLAAGLLVAGLVGWLAGLAWVRLLRGTWARGHESLATVGAVFLVYAVAETLRGSGPLAVLAFALVLGNSPHATVIARTALGTTGPPTFHRQAALAVRAFVFVGLGATLDLAALLRPRLLAFGVLCVLAVAAARGLAVRLGAWRILPDRWDRVSVSLMFPLGLPTAAASLIPSARFGLAGTEGFPEVAAVVILLSIVVSSVLVALALQPGARRRLGAPAASAAP